MKTFNKRFLKYQTSHLILILFVFPIISIGSYIFLYYQTRSQIIKEKIQASVLKNYDKEKTVVQDMVDDIELYLGKKINTDFYFSRKMPLYKKESKNGQTISVCYRFFRKLNLSMNTVLIHIDYWKKLNTSEKYIILLHEIGHCQFNKNHNQNLIYIPLYKKYTPYFSPMNYVKIDKKNLYAKSLMHHRIIDFHLEGNAKYYLQTFKQNVTR